MKTYSKEYGVVGEELKANIVHIGANSEDKATRKLRTRADYIWEYFLKLKERRGAALSFLS